jgi:hypothetical protein
MIAGNGFGGDQICETIEAIDTSAAEAIRWRWVFR